MLTWMPAWPTNKTLKSSQSNNYNKPIPSNCIIRLLRNSIRVWGLITIG